MAVAPRTTWPDQDTACICKRDGRLSHAQWQFNCRCPPRWRGYPVRAAWRESDEHDRPGRGTVRRVHRPSGMLLIAEWGFLQTALPARWIDD